MVTDLSRGALLPSVSLPAANRKSPVSLWDYRQKRNLVLLLIPDFQRYRPLLESIATHYDEYRELESELLAIVPAPLEELRQHMRELDLPFPVLSDSEARFWQQGTGMEAGEDSPPGIALIADRWGEVYARMSVTTEADSAAVADDLQKWLQFVEMQCAECFPPEWPASASS